MKQYREFLKHYAMDLNDWHETSGGGDNDTFVVSDGGAPTVLRVYRTTDNDEIPFELDVIDFLVENGFPTPAVVRTRDGARSVQIGNRVAVMFDFAPGDPIGEKTRQNGCMVAALAGRLNRLTQNVSFPGVRSRSDAGRIRTFLEFVGSTPSIATKPGCSQFCVTAAQLLDWIREVIDQQRLPMGVIHRDWNGGNVLVDSGGSIAAVLDFDEAYYGPHIFDIASIVHYWADRESFHFESDSVRALLDAYQSERMLGSHERSLLNTALAAFHAADASEFLFRKLRKGLDTVEFADCRSLHTMYAVLQNDAFVV